MVGARIVQGTLIFVGLVAVSILGISATVDFTIGSWGPNQYPSNTQPPDHAPWGPDGYPGDMLEMLGSTGTLNLTPGTYIEKVNTFDWIIDYTYGGTETDPGDWSDIDRSFTASRSISFDGGPTGTLQQTVRLQNTWHNDDVTIYEGMTASFRIGGYTVDVTPLAVARFGGSSFRGGNPWDQPDVDVSARFVVTELPDDVVAPATVLTSVPPTPDNASLSSFAWTGSDDRTEEGNLEYSTNLDGAGWSSWSTATSKRVGPISDGEHTLSVRARDEAGNLGAAATHTWIVDATPPAIALNTPEDGAAYLLGRDVRADWIVREVGSGLSGAVQATTRSGSRVDTTVPGSHAYFVEVTDQAGNTTRADVFYRVIYDLTPPGAGGGGADTTADEEMWLLDRCAEGGGASAGDGISVIYEAGESIGISFNLADADGRVIDDATCSATFVQAGTNANDPNNIVLVVPVVFDEELGLYSVDVLTIREDWQLNAGPYTIWIGLEDGTHMPYEIEIIESEG